MRRILFLLCFLTEWTPEWALFALEEAVTLTEQKRELQGTRAHHDAWC